MIKYIDYCVCVCVCMRTPENILKRKYPEVVCFTNQTRIFFVKTDLFIDCIEL